jgi:hypothetical protein
MKGIFTQRKRRRRHHRASRTATGGKGDARLAAKPEAPPVPSPTDGDSTDSPTDPSE